MSKFGFSLLVILCGLCWGATLGVAEPAEYQSGYDPKTSLPEGVREIPDSAWGEEVKGLQAAISGPREIRFNERGRFFLVVRNISDVPLKVTLRSQAAHPYLTPEGEPTATGGYSNHKQFARFQIFPDHHIAIPFPNITVVRGDGIAPTHAKMGLSPGKHFIASSISAGGENWEVVTPDEPGRRVVYADDEWLGRLETKPHPLLLLDEDVDLRIDVPEEFAAAPDLKPSLTQPDSIDFDGSDFHFRQGLRIYLNRATDSHWFVESGGFDRNLFWGPFSAEQLKANNLLDPIESQLRKNLADAEMASSALWEMRKLTVLQKPIVEMVFDLIPAIGDPTPGLANNGYDFMTRAIRDRQIELRDLGLQKEIADALRILTEHLPPLPPESEFQTVAITDNPADAPIEEIRWGPENDGLRAAALVENEIVRSKTTEVRLFIKNTSDEPVFLTVADRPGYDTASATDAKGNPLKVENESVYPMGFSSVIHPETDPGLSAQNPPTARLVRLKLQPGAIWELKTKTALHYFQSNETRPVTGSQFGEKSIQHPAVASIVTEPTVALVTWELHTANGAQYTDDLRGRIWPAKGGWSGLLHTAPIPVKLVEE